MIFENSTEQQKTQPAMANNNQQSQPLYQAPPAYGSAYFYPAAGPAGTNVVFLREDEHRRRRRRLLVFAGIFFIFLVGTFRWSSGGGDDGQWRANPEDYPIPDNVDLNHCTEGDQWSNIHTNPLSDLPHTAETHFDLPLSSDTLFFIERGDLSGGTVTIKTDNQLKEDQVHVKVVIHYRHDWVRDYAKVCQTTRGPNENGIGIFTPHFRSSRPRDARLLFDITISLPPSRSQRVIKKFESELHNTNHRVETLRNYVFDTIDLQGTNGGIETDDIVSTKGDIRTTNGPIKGAFHTTNSLTIKSTNGRVNVNVGAIATKSVTPKVVVTSSNGDLQAAFSLTSDSKKGGEFDVTASTTNSKLDVQFPVQPLDSVLRFKGTTTNGQARLSLNPAFEGKFEGHTTNAQGSVEVDHSVSDPSGKNRKRNVSVVQTKNRNVYGSAYWSDNHDVEGTAFLKTSNGRLTLRL